jgi:hypothetical protein
LVRRDGALVDRDENERIRGGTGAVANEDFVRFRPGLTDTGDGERPTDGGCDRTPDQSSA